MTLLDIGLDDGQWEAVSRILESYLLRRAVCGLTTKNYNRTFLGLTRTLRHKDPTPEHLAKLLGELSGDSTEWPTDDKFGEAWRTVHAYQVLSNPKIVHVLKRLSDTYVTGKMEGVTVSGDLTVEHILPQQWQAKWPLVDGSTGLATDALWKAAKDDPTAEATRKRNAALQTMGNLTILTQGLNSAVSNSEWPVKKPSLLQHSLLPINQQLHAAARWDEEAISRRGEDLLGRALTLWPRVYCVMAL